MEPSADDIPAKEASVATIADTVHTNTSETYQIRPDHDYKFKTTMVKEMIHSVLNDELGGKTYNKDEAEVWIKAIANTLRGRVREMPFKKYKYIVQVVICEQHGAGIKIGARCLWDADADNYACDTFINDTLVCMAVIFAVYFY